MNDRPGPVRILGASISGVDGQSGRFAAGQRARVSVQIEAAAPTEKVAVVLDVFNTEFYEVFNTSSERLGHPPLSLAAGDRANCEFDLELNLGPGTYYLGLYLYRYDIEREYDHVFPATSFVVTTDRDTRGAANLYPKVARFDTVRVNLARAVGV
jgi:hypothetical protein